MKQKRTRRALSLAEISSLEALVRALAKSLEKNFDELKKMLYFARHPGQIMVVDEEGFQSELKKMPPAPLFEPFFTREPAQKGEAYSLGILERLIWMALLKADADPDKTWAIFRDYLTTVPLGMRAVLDGINVVKNRRKGGKADKRAKAIMAKVQAFVDRAPRLSANAIWKLFPSEQDQFTVRLADGEYTIFREEESLVQVDPRGNERIVSIDTLGRYVRKARKNRSGTN